MYAIACADAAMERHRRMNTLYGRSVFCTFNQRMDINARRDLVRRVRAMLDEYHTLQKEQARLFAMDISKMDGRQLLMQHKANATCAKELTEHNARSAALVEECKACDLADETREIDALVAQLNKVSI